MPDSPLPVMRGKFLRGPVNKAAARKLAAHLKYNEYRSMSEGETRESRATFSQNQDRVQRNDAVRDVLSHTSPQVNYHKIILSPGEHEHISDLRQWTRDVIYDLSERKGITLHWYANVHTNTDNPHVHVVLAGAGEDHQTGATRTVGMYKEDYAFLREQGREHSHFELYQQLERTMRELDRYDLTQQPPDLERNPFDDSLTR
jgi:hypothetical protein